MVTLNMHFESKNNLNKNRRVASRGILIHDGKILMSHEETNDQWMIPGGGVENNESLVECCSREVAEETGVIISPTKLYLTINEYFDDMVYVNHYFIAEYVRETERKLTDIEKKNGLTPKWISIDKAIDIFSRYDDYAQSDPMKCGLYRRERAALAYYKAAIFGKNAN